MLSALPRLAPTTVNAGRTPYHTAPSSWTKSACSRTRLKPSSVNPGVEQTAASSTRVIAATSRDLEKDVKTGRFRHDLFFRLNVVTIHLPPLRQRREDIPRLTAKILADVCLRHHRQPLQLAPDVRAVLGKYDWRGNLRELATVIEHATILARADMIQLTDLPERLLASS
jgi:DNA-binding NtrC family response regulator